jgi:hypothetical protein
MTLVAMWLIFAVLCVITAGLWTIAVVLKGDK